MSWRKCPFVVGKRYQLLQNICFLNHRLTKGDLVVFLRDAYDPHDGVTRFSFKHCDSEETSSWHVWDDDPDPAENWRNYFSGID
jgi:hypothetical protein